MSVSMCGRKQVLGYQRENTYTALSVLLGNTAAATGGGGGGSRAGGGSGGPDAGGSSPGGGGELVVIHRWGPRCGLPALLDYGYVTQVLRYRINRCKSVAGWSFPLS